MELWVWVGDFGLISMNSECISTISYIKISKAPVTIHFSKNPYMMLYGDFPIFRHDSVTLCNYFDIVNYLKLNEYNADYKLNRKQISESYTLVHMIMGNLKPLLEYTFWINIVNYKRLTSAWYANVITFPFCLVYPSKRKKLACGIVESNPQHDMNTIEAILRTEAEQCLNCLSYNLGKGPYFFGEKPTSLDIVAFAILSQPETFCETFWINIINYKRLTSAWYANVITFPFCLVYPSKRKKLACGIVESNPQHDMNTIEAILRTEAEQCLNCLSYNLGKGPYFFGEKPTSLDIVDYLKLNEYNTDYKLNRKQISESYTLVHMIMGNLKPLLEYTFWINIVNYKRLTSAWYANVITFPFCLVYPSKRKKLACGIVESNPQHDMNTIEAILRTEAEQCLNCLSYNLGKGPYFFGEKPTSLDIVAFAYLAPIIKIPFPSNLMLNLLESYPNLKHFVKRFDGKLFSKVEQQNKYLNYTVSGLTVKSHEDYDVTMSWSSKLLILSTALCAMVLYAMSKNVIDFSRWNYFVVN
ncbi:hypothetical protein FQR65_LT11489 [Abscondita terminalis]|nr:hypothetical protein FQR65_LT11489 [Abscondita terminalis]